MKYFYKYNRKIDFLLYVVTPLLIGTVVYSIKSVSNSYNFIKIFLPDGLWSYSFISCVLLIWDRHIKIEWMITTFTIFILIEVMQYFHVMNGTGDILDVLVYFTFASCALFTNKYHSKSLKNKG